jgi:hypothetical protein
MLNNSSSNRFPNIELSAIMFVLTVISLLFTVVFAIKTVSISEFSYPDLDEVFKLPETNITSLKKEYVATLIHSVLENEAIIDEKAAYLSASLVWFKNSLFFFLTISIIIALSLLSSANIAPSLFLRTLVV